MFGIIINKDGYKVAFVCLDEEGGILHYTLNKDEQLITTDWQVANTMGKPKWTGTEWVDEEPPQQIEIDISPIKTNEDLTKENTELKTALADTQDLLIEMSHSIF